MKQGCWIFEMYCPTDPLHNEGSICVPVSRGPFCSECGTECKGDAVYKSNGNYFYKEHCPNCGIPMRPLPKYELRERYVTGDPSLCKWCGREVVYQFEDGQLKPENFCPHCGRKIFSEPPIKKKEKYEQLSIFDEEKKDD